MAQNAPYCQIAEGTKSSWFCPSSTKTDPTNTLNGGSNNQKLNYLVVGTSYLETLYTGEHTNYQTPDQYWHYQYQTLICASTLRFVILMQRITHSLQLVIK